MYNRALMTIAVLMILIWISIYLWVRPTYVDLVLSVQVPTYTPADRVCAIGNLSELGEWKNHSLKLQPAGDFKYKTTLRVREGVRVELKFTLGDWGTVQKDRNFFDVGNNEFIVSRKTPLMEFIVENFAGFESRVHKATLTGQFEYLHHVKSTFLNNERTVMVWLPPSYGASANTRYPVLYMHDGNNLFDARTAFGGVEWGVDEAASRLIQQGLIREIIIVGVYNTMGRMEEYTPTVSRRHGGGDGEKYLNFLTQELMPEINSRFRTLTDPALTGIMGSSLGGLISLWAGFRYHEFFQLIGAVSPSLWWDERFMETKFIPSCNRLQHKVWLDMGSHEGMGKDGVSYAMKDTQKMAELLRSKGYKDAVDLYYFEHMGAYHNEASWAARIHMPLLYFYGIGEPTISLNKPWENSDRSTQKIN